MRIVLPVAFFFAISACATAPDNTRFYLLSDTTSSSSECPVSIGRVVLPGYLNRANIVVKSAEHRLTPATNHRWSEPLDEASRRLLGACMNADAKEIADVTIQHFHGNTTGETVLEATWQLRSVDKVNRFNQQRQQATSGYDALVATQQLLLLDLCATICTN